MDRDADVTGGGDGGTGGGSGSDGPTGGVGSGFTDGAANLRSYGGSSFLGGSISGVSRPRARATSKRPWRRRVPSTAWRFASPIGFFGDLLVAVGTRMTARPSYPKHDVGNGSI